MTGREPPVDFPGEPASEWVLDVKTGQWGPWDDIARVVRQRLPRDAVERVRRQQHPQTDDNAVVVDGATADEVTWVEARRRARTRASIHRLASDLDLPTSVRETAGDIYNRELAAEAKWEDLATEDVLRVFYATVFRDQDPDALLALYAACQEEGVSLDLSDIMHDIPHSGERWAGKWPHDLISDDWFSKTRSEDNDQ